MENSGSKEEEVSDVETRCGVLGCYPKWLQVLSSKKSYVLLFGLVGLNQLAIGSYAVATITTLEKRFKIPSQTSGLITGGWDIGTIFSSITMAYIGSKGHKTRWVAFGTFLTSVACYSQLLPYIIYGPGSDALAIAKSGNSTGQSSSSSALCGVRGLQEENCEAGDTTSAPPVLIFMSQFLLGVGTSMYWTLGLAYLDDNVRKSQTPWLMAISASIRLFGSPLGFWVASKSLEYYVDPTLTPSITNEDARWIGAWWIGWIPFGVIATFYSYLFLLFPRILPRALIRQRIKKKIERKVEGPTPGFLAMVQRLMSNPLLIFNTFSYVFYMLGTLGYWVFMPKYMETQYHMTASNANLVTGTMGLLSSAAGVLLSGLVLSKLKPSARTIALWNVSVEVFGIVCTLIAASLGCSNFNLHGSWDSSGSWSLRDECNAACNCDPGMAYQPVCDPSRSLTFYSPCHAGCSGETRNASGYKFFTNCRCIPDTLTAVDSLCPVECQYNLTIFLVLYCVVTFLSAFSHAGLAIIQFRAVKPEDKSVSIALSEMMCSILAYIPGPVFYGYLVDKACLVWDSTCGEQGNCWLYHDKTFRYYLNYTSAGFLMVAVFFDCGIWRYSKNLSLYDDKSDKEEGSEEGEPMSARKSSKCNGDLGSQDEQLALQHLKT